MISVSNEEAIKVLRLFKECNAKTQPQIVFDSIDNVISALESIDRITAERDAAIAELEHFKDAFKAQVQGERGVFHCDACKYGGEYLSRDDIGKKCPKGCDGFSQWEWRGK